MEVIDAKDTILGRMATEVAKKALNGEEIVIVNSEFAVISGNKKAIFEKYLRRKQRGTPQHGPFFPTSPEKIVRRAIRGMISYKTKRGREAYKRIKVFRGIPEEYKDKELKKVGKQVDKLKCKFVFVYELSKFLGNNK